MQLPDPFPPFDPVSSPDLIAVSDVLTPELLLAAYRRGLFPWTDNPVGWFCPNPRAVFALPHVRLPSNLPKLSRRQGFSVTFDKAFVAVMEHCAAAHRHDGVWITQRFIDAYAQLHHRGYAHSVEVWQQQRLVGGLYGVLLGGTFSGESMFSAVSNASKAALAALVDKLQSLGVSLIDAQILNPHTQSLGAFEIPRYAFLQHLARTQQQGPLSASPW